MKVLYGAFFIYREKGTTWVEGSLDVDLAELKLKYI